MTPATKFERDPLRWHRDHRKHLIGSSFPERLVEHVAEGIGTTVFLAVALLIIIAWITINGGYGFFSGAFAHVLHGKPFDPAPWILLNLVFSFEAFFTGSLVVIAAKAQAKRDKNREEADAKHREEVAQRQEELIGQNTALTQQVHDLSLQIHEVVSKAT